MVRKKLKFHLIKSEDALKQCEASIQSSSRRLTIEITKVYVSQAWELVGLNDFKYYTSLRLPDFHYDTLLHRARCGEVMLNIAGEDAVGLYSLNSMVPMLDLKIQDQKRVFECLQQQYGDENIPTKWLTRKRVEGAIALIFGEQELSEKDTEVSNNEPAVTNDQSAQMSLDNEENASQDVDNLSPVVDSNGRAENSQGETKWSTYREQFINRLSNKPVCKSFNKHLVQCVADTLSTDVLEKACKLLAKKGGFQIELTPISAKHKSTVRKNRTRSRPKPKCARKMKVQ